GDADGVAPGGAVVGGLAVVDVEDAGVGHFAVVVPDGVEEAVLVGFDPGFDLVGVGDAGRGEGGGGGPGGAIVGGAAVIDAGLAGAAIGPDDDFIAVGAVHRVGGDGIQPPGAAAAIVGRAGRAGVAGDGVEGAEADAAVGGAAVADAA